MSRAVLVTGASRGIGRAIAMRLAGDGFDVVLHYRTDRGLAEAVQAEIAETGGGDVRLLQFDVRQRLAVARILEQDIDEHGAYYGVVCNAGIVRDGPFPGMPDEDWDDVVDTSLSGFYNVVRPLVLPMVQRRSGGRIVTIASVSGLTGNRGQVNYSAAKGAVIAAGKALAVELASRGITVNCVAPGLIETDMTADLPRDRILAAIPAARFGRVDEVAALVGFLFSDGAEYITRQVISVNGGMIG